LGDGRFLLSIDCIIFLSQLTLSTCVWWWSCHLSRRSRCESRWACWCVGTERGRSWDDLLYVLISDSCNKLYETFLYYELVIMMSPRNITTAIKF